MTIMKKGFIVFTLTLLLTGIVFAEEIQWIKIIDGNHESEAIVKTVPCPDGSYIVSGYTQSTDLPGIPLNGGDDAFIAKFSATGDYLWIKGFGSVNDDRIYGVHVGQDNSTYIAFNSAAGTNINTLLCKIDTNGVVLWEKTIENTGTCSVIEARPGNNIALRFSNDYMIYDEAGTYIEQEPLPNIPQGMVPVSDGGYIKYEGVTVTKYNSALTEEWTIDLKRSGMYDSISRAIESKNGYTFIKQYHSGDYDAGCYNIAHIDRTGKITNDFLVHVSNYMKKSIPAFYTVKGDKIVVGFTGEKYIHGQLADESIIKLFDENLKQLFDFKTAAVIKTIKQTADEGFIIGGASQYNGLYLRKLCKHLGNPTPYVYKTVSTGKPAYASTEYSSNYKAAMAVDGNQNTLWGTIDANTQQWLYVDLTADTDVRRIVVNWYEGYQAVDFQVAVSLDAANWTFVNNTTGNTEALTTIDTQQTARYVGILCTKKSFAGYAIKEFEVQTLVEQQ